jgi:hypothetical protein
VEKEFSLCKRRLFVIGIMVCKFCWKQKEKRQLMCEPSMVMTNA